MSQELKALGILTKLSNSMKDNEGIINWDCSIDFFNKTNEAIKELEEYEQNFKQKEFDYRTQCQELLSEGRVEAENMPDRLAELEKVILDYYLDKGYQLGVGGWGFHLQIDTYYKLKSLVVFFRKNKGSHYSEVFEVKEETTKAMFDKVIAHFSTQTAVANKQ